MKTIQSRRDFLRISATGTLGAIAVSKIGYEEKLMAVKESPADDLKSYGIALQLYTIREAMKTDVAGSLKKVSDAGYKYLELADYTDGKFHGMMPLDFKKVVNDLGMEILSSHTQVEKYGNVLDYVKKMSEDHAKLGAKYCIQSWVEEKDRKTVASFQKMADTWNKVGAITKASGIQFGYHNHNFEFGKVEGKIPYFDIFLKVLDKELVTMELDLFWATKAGQNPVEIFKKYPGRFQLFHMKDMFTKQPPLFTTDGITDFAPVGEGLINFREILASRDLAGMKYMIVEQDSSREGKPFDDIKTSITNLTKKILV